MKKKLKSIFLISIVLPIIISCNKEKTINENAARMQQFVEDISKYAKVENPEFIIIPQNGAELAFHNVDPDAGIKISYCNAIDGMGIEELFYNGKLNVDNKRLSMLKMLKNNLKMMVSDYVSNNENIPDAIDRNKKEGFIAFPRSKNNYNYKFIPDISRCK